MGLAALLPFLGGMKKSSVGGVGSRMMEDASGAVQGAFREKVAGWAGKVFGLPSPGKQQAQFMDEAFPGTNPWERLGSSAGGGGGAEVSYRRQQMRQQERVVDKQLATQRYAADQQRNASVVASIGPENPDMAPRLMEMARTGSDDVSGGPKVPSLTRGEHRAMDIRVRAQDLDLKARDISQKKYGLQTERARYDLDKVLNTFNAKTQRLVAEVQQGRLDLSQFKVRVLDTANTVIRGIGTIIPLALAPLIARSFLSKAFRNTGIMRMLNMTKGKRPRFKGGRGDTVKDLDFGKARRYELKP